MAMLNNQMVIQVISHRHTLVPPSFQQRFITQVLIRPHCHAKKFAPILRLPSFLPMRQATVTFRNFHAKQVLWSERHHSQCGIPSVRNRDVWSIAALIKSRTTFLRGERENGQSPVNRMIYHIRYVQISKQWNLPPWKISLRWHQVSRILEAKKVEIRWN